MEILFIDIAKTPDLNAHAVAQFFPALIPGHSVVLHQDYFHCWHPYIHYGMEYLDEEFELIDEHVPHQTRVWQLARPIPQEKIDRLGAMDLTKAERLALLDRLIAKSSDFSRPMIEVVKIWQMCLDRDWDLAADAMATFRAEREPEGRNVLWARQALQVESHILKAVG